MVSFHQTILPFDEELPFLDQIQIRKKGEQKRALNEFK